MEWNPVKGAPYIVAAETDLLKQIAKDDVICGYTVSCIGFYSPQGRGLRLPLEDTNFKEKLVSFKYGGKQICNIDMESASIIGMASLLGHRAVSCCVVEETAQSSVLSENKAFGQLLELALDRI